MGNDDRANQITREVIGPLSRAHGSRNSYDLTDWGDFVKDDSALTGEVIGGPYSRAHSSRNSYDVTEWGDFMNDNSANTREVIGGPAYGIVHKDGSHNSLDVREWG